MKMLRKALALSALGAAALGATQGCADNESLIFVRQVMVLESPECNATADATGAFLTGGVLDVAFSSNYQAVLLIGNQLVQRGSRELLRTETSKVTLRGAEVRLLNSQEQAIAGGEFTVPASGFVDQASGNTPGFGLTTVTLIPPAIADGLANQLNPNEATTLIASVKVFGETLGGESVDSSRLTFPISVCFGCLVTFPPDADDPASPGFQCSLGGSTGGQTDTVTADELPCFFGQDEPVDCRLCCAAFIGVEPFNTICGCG